MSRRNRAVFPMNQQLRRAVYRLLLTAPMLPLWACGSDAGGCGVPLIYPIITHANYTLPDGSQPAAGADCAPLCEALKERAENCSLTSNGTSTTLTCHSTVGHCYDGRRPEGLVERLAVGPDVLGAFYGQMAFLEAASVPAFLRLAEELEAHGAPASLVKAARRSAGDEVRHARAAQALARAHGAEVPEVEIAPFQPRSLWAMARENAVEGCVRELFGALVTGWQSRTAADEEVRRVLGPIAEDELDHAELAWAVDAWAQTKLSSAQQDELRVARAQVLEELRREHTTSDPSPELVRWAGLPSREAAVTLLSGLTDFATA